MNRTLNRIIAALGSRRFFRITLGLFLFEAAWIACSAVYPQAFDENFHFGLIQIYSHHWLPFLTSQPAHANAYGAVARDPSYLYHYLMSFPYRLIALFIHGRTGQVIALRLINIGLFGVGLWLFRRVLLRVGSSRALTNVILFLFVLIPIVPQLAGQINYDNLLLPLVAGVCLLTFRVADALRQKWPSARDIIILASVCLLGSLVKYAFLPIFVGVVVFVGCVAYKNFRGTTKNLRRQIGKSWSQESRLAKALLVVVLLVSFGMFMQRDGVNLITYHAIEPNCDAVLNVKDCSVYSPWDYNYHQHREVVRHAATIHFDNPIKYVGEWLYWMWYRLFFAINGPEHSFTNYPPLPLPSAAAALLGIAGSAAVMLYWRRLFRNNAYLTFLFLISGLYLAALMAQGFSTYHYTNVLENMNGRYLLPVLLPVAVVGGRALSLALRRMPQAKVWLAGLSIVFFLQGGGLLTFIARSNKTWDWPTSAVIHVNNAARHMTDPLLINGKETYDTYLWFFN